MNRRHDDEAPVLITEAAPSFDEEFSARKKRYTLIMACRIPCLLLAGVFGIGFNLPIVAVLFIVLSVPLPWVAVLIANDRLPKKSEKVNRYRRDARQIEDTDRRVIEAAEVLDARETRDPSTESSEGHMGPSATRTDGVAVEPEVSGDSGAGDGSATGAPPGPATGSAAGATTGPTTDEGEPVGEWTRRQPPRAS